MDLKELAQAARKAVSEVRTFGRELRTTHGIEVLPGFFNVWNEVTGQSKVVLLHPESGYVFKESYTSWDDDAITYSRRYIGEVTLEGNLVFKIRLPEVHFFADLDLEVQEYVNGENCGCETWNKCGHTPEIKRVSKCSDAHFGNWKFVGDEIVLFDYDGIRLD